MNRKRFTSMFLAAALAAVMTVPAFASATQSISVTGATTTPKIELIISGTKANKGTLVLNPYRMDYTVKTSASAGGPNGDKTDNSPIVCTPVVIRNKTSVPVEMSATVTGKPASSVTLTSPVKKTAGDQVTWQLPQVNTYKVPSSNALTTSLYNTKRAKQVFMFLEARTLQTGSEVIIDEETGLTYAVEEIEWSGADAYTNESNQILVSKTAIKKDNVLTLPAAVDQDGEAETNYAAFTLIGDVTDAPAAAWTAADKIDVSVAMTFTAVANENTD